MRAPQSRALCGVVCLSITNSTFINSSIVSMLSLLDFLKCTFVILLHDPDNLCFLSLMVI